MIDGNETYCGDHFIMYINIDYIVHLKLIIYINYSSIENSSNSLEDFLFFSTIFRVNNQVSK